MHKFISDTYEKLILALLLIEYIFVNLVFTTYTQNIVILKDIASPLFSLLIFAVWVIGDLARYGKFMLPRNGIVPVTVVALLYWAGCVFTSPGTATAVYWWSTMWAYFVQVWAVLKVLDSFKKLSAISNAVIITNFLVVGYGLTQLAGMDILVELGLIPDWGSNVFVSTHGNPNFLAGYLISTIPVLVGIWFITRNPIYIVGLPILVACNLFEVVKSTARGAYIAMALYIPTFIFILGWHYRRLHIISDTWWKGIFKITAAVLVVAILIVGVVAFDKVEDFGIQIYQQFYTLVDFEGNYTNWVRFVFFQMATDGVLRAPLFGRGLGTFNHQMPETRVVWYHRTGVSHNTDHPHNEHLEWLFDTGFIGLSVFWLILVTYFWLGFRQIKRHRDSFYFPFVLSAFYGPWCQWIQATFDVETRWTGNSVTMWFGVGLVLAFVNLPVVAKREEEEALTAVQPVLQKTRKQLRAANLRAATGSGGYDFLNPSPYLPVISIICLLTVGFYVKKSYDFWMADHHLRNNMAYTDANQGSINSALNEAELARELCYMNMSNYYKLAYTYLVAGKLESAMNSYRDLQAFAPNYAQIHINLAFLNDQMGFRTASAWERDRAATIEHNTKNHRDAAQYWLQLGYSHRALAHMRQCFTIELERLENGYYFWYDHDNLRSELARIYMQLGEKQNAENELAQALQLNPNNVLAAVLLTQLYTEGGDHERTSELEATLQKYAPSNPALLVLKMSRSVAEKDFATALQLADEASSGLPLPPPNGQPSQEAANLGNSLLSMLQVVFGANFNQTKCLEVAGWIYATQSRYSEAEQFLGRAYQMTSDARTGERLARVRAHMQS
ncbi:MAG: O-antigen ligase family protein [Candidatus Hydrogenedentota bacterium]